MLAQICKDFLVEPSRYDEKAQNLSAAETVTLFAREKAREVFSRFPHAAVLGADTVVYFEGEILGKPKNPTHAIQMLKKLSGKTHSVFTGVCLIGDGFEEQFLAESHVTFYDLDGKMIEEYVASGKPLDKAGAYGIQDGFPIVCGYEGSYSNIVGLPVEETRAILKKRRLL